MSSWASRLSTATKSGASSPSVDTRRGKSGNEAAAVTGAASPTSSATGAASPLTHGPGVWAAASSKIVATAAAGPIAPDLREEFRQVAEAFNEASACMLRLPPDCWDILTEYLSYVDVVALGQTCRTLWVVLHARESVWWRQLAYFHRDVRDLRGGKLLSTAYLFPRPPSDANASQQESLAPSPTIAPPVAAASGLDGRPRSFAARTRRSDWMPMSAYERFFQERRVYVLDAHREWHFQELADVEDKATGMFTVALHDGTVESFASPLSAEAASLSFASAMTPPPAQLPRTTQSAALTPLQAALDSAQDTSLVVMPPSPISLMPPVGRGSSLGPAPTPHRRTGSIQTPGTSAGNSPALAPSPAPPTPPLLPRVGEPIINEHNPLLQLRIYTIDAFGGQRSFRVEDEGKEQVDEDEEGSYTNPSRGPPAHRVEPPPVNLAGMTEEEVLAYVMEISLQEAEQAARQASTPAHNIIAAPLADSSQSALETSADKSRRTDPACWPHTHYRGANGATSLPLSKLLIIIDSINNNAVDQLDHHHVRDCTADEDPRFLRRLAETLRSAKHRRLHLGNHHRAVRNNGQTTRNRAGRNAASDSAGFSVSNTSLGAGGAASPSPAPPPPMNRMLRGFHGDLLELTEREARTVATNLLGKPHIIDDFVVFRCYNPAEFYHRLCPPCADATPALSATTAALEMHPSGVSAGRQVMKHGMLVSVPAPLYVDPAPPTAAKGSRDTVAAAPTAALASASASLPLSSDSPACPPTSQQTVMRSPPLKALPFFTRFFLAPELCHEGYIALIVVDVVRALVVVDKEVVGTDNPDWESPLIDRGGRVVVPGQGYNPQAYTRNDYNYVPPVQPRRSRASN